jgi:cytosine permease
MGAKTYPWTKVAPTLGVIFVSPAILTVGSTLGAALPFGYAVLTSVVAAFTVSTLIYLHGGSGARMHLPFVRLMESSLGVSGSRFLASPLIIVTQVGWFAVLITLGGEAAFKLAGTDRLALILAFGAVVAAVTYLGFSRLSDFTKVTASLTGAFAVWSLYTILAKGPSLAAPVTSSPNLLYMTGLAIGGATSISTVSPDFLRDARSPRDVRITAFGIVLPLILFTLISGNLLGNYTVMADPVFALAAIDLPLLANLLLLLGSTAAASSLYPPTIALANIAKISRRYATIPVAAAGLFVAYLGIVQQLSVFLRLIGVLLPPLIGINLAQYYFLTKGKADPRKGVNLRGVASWIVGAGVGALPFGVAPIQALVSSFLLYYALEKYRKS